MTINTRKAPVGSLNVKLGDPSKSKGAKGPIN